MTPRSVAQRTADADTLDRWLRQQRPADALTGDLLAGPLADPGRHARDPGAEAGQAGARALARQLREAAEQRHAVAAARAGRSRACPFDLHALVPVPDAVLRLGPDHPDALAWLWAHWGTTQALRHMTEDRVAALGRHKLRRRDPGTLHLSFWSADWTP